jgi:hypothetical protein
LRKARRPNQKKRASSGLWTFSSPLIPSTAHRQIPRNSHASPLRAPNSTPQTHSLPAPPSAL